MLKYLDGLTSENLKKICRDENIHGYSTLKKKLLLQHIKKHKLNLLIKKGMDQLVALG